MVVIVAQYERTYVGMVTYICNTSKTRQEELTVQGQLSKILSQPQLKV